MVNPDSRDEERGNDPRISHLGLLRRQRLPLGLGHPQGVMEGYLAVGVHFSIGVPVKATDVLFQNEALSRWIRFGRLAFPGAGQCFDARRALFGGHLLELLQSGAKSLRRKGIVGPVGAAGVSTVEGRSYHLPASSQDRAKSPTIRSQRDELLVDQLHSRI